MVKSRNVSGELTSVSRSESARTLPAEWMAGWRVCGRGPVRCAQAPAAVKLSSVGLQSVGRSGMGGREGRVNCKTSPQNMGVQLHQYCSIKGDRWAEQGQEEVTLARSGRDWYLLSWVVCRLNQASGGCKAGSER